MAWGVQWHQFHFSVAHGITPAAINLHMQLGQFPQGDFDWFCRIEG
jgi:hypothetical protein